MYCGLYMPLCPGVITGMEGVEWVRGPGDVGVLVDLFCIDKKKSRHCIIVPLMPIKNED